MPEMDAKVVTQYEFTGTAVGGDGYEAEILMDDSFRGWWSIVRWNFHYRHWRALSMNARDLFTKVIRRKLWRR